MVGHKGKDLCQGCYTARRRTGEGFDGLKAPRRKWRFSERCRDCSRALVGISVIPKEGEARHKIDSICSACYQQRVREGTQHLR